MQRNMRVEEIELPLLDDLNNNNNQSVTRPNEVIPINNNSPDLINNLPAEDLAKILGYLTADEKDLAKKMTVCKNFNTIINNLPTDTKISERNQDGTIAKNEDGTVKLKKGTFGEVSRILNKRNQLEKTKKAVPALPTEEVEASCRIINSSYQAEATLAAGIIEGAGAGLEVLTNATNVISGPALPIIGHVAVGIGAVLGAITLFNHCMEKRDQKKKEKHQADIAAIRGHRAAIRVFNKTVDDQLASDPKLQIYRP